MTADRAAQLYGDGAASAERDRVDMRGDVWSEENLALPEGWTPRERAFFTAGHLEGWTRYSERLDDASEAERRESLARRCARGRRELAEYADALVGVSAEDYAYMCALARDGLASEIAGE